MGGRQSVWLGAKSFGGLCHRGSILTSTNDDILGPTNDANVALFVHDSNVTRAHPRDLGLIWVSLDCFVSSLRVFPVAFHDNVAGGLISVAGSVSVRNGGSRETIK